MNAENAVKAEKPVKAAKAVKAAKIAITENNISKAAMRILGQRLVSPETAFVREKLGATATQQQLDDSIVAVRKMPWAKIAKFAR